MWSRWHVLRVICQLGLRQIKLIINLFSNENDIRWSTSHRQVGNPSVLSDSSSTSRFCLTQASRYLQSDIHRSVSGVEIKLNVFLLKLRNRHILDSGFTWRLKTLRCKLHQFIWLTESYANTSNSDHELPALWWYLIELVWSENEHALKPKYWIYDGKHANVALLFSFYNKYFI